MLPPVFTSMPSDEPVTPSPYGDDIVIDAAEPSPQSGGEMDELLAEVEALRAENGRLRSALDAITMLGSRALDVESAGTDQ